MDFEVDRHPPADFQPGDLLITMVKEAVKTSFEKIKKKLNFFVSVIDLIMGKTPLTARLPVTVSTLQTWS